jgi:hypothetical protein
MHLIAKNSLFEVFSFAFWSGSRRKTKEHEKK